MATTTLLIDCDGVLQHSPHDWEDALARIGGGPSFAAALFEAEKEALRGERPLRAVVDELLRERPTGASTQDVLDLWDRALTAVETGDLAPVAGEIDWIAKKRLLDGYATRHGLGLDDPRLAQLDLTYHDIDPKRGLFGLSEARGRMRRIVDDAAVQRAVTDPPATTRAALRGAFVGAARAAQRDHTVDWTHLRLNDGTPRTVLCKDPFAATDERVTALLDEIAAGLPGSGVRPGA